MDPVFPRDDRPFLFAGFSLWDTFAEPGSRSWFSEIGFEPGKRHGLELGAFQRLVDSLGPGKSERVPVKTGQGPGGRSLNAARVFARKGSPCAFFGKIGTDRDRDYATSLAAEGIRDLVLRDGAVGTGGRLVVDSKEAGRTVFVAPGAAGSLRSDDIPEGWTKDARALHLGGWLLSCPGVFQRLVSEAKRGGVRVSVDLTHAELAVRYRDMLAPVVEEAADVVFARQEEIGALLGSVYVSMLKLIAHDRIIVVKKSGKGADAYWSGGRVSCENAAFRESEGSPAGETFAGTFLAELDASADIEHSLNAACRAGVLAAARPSGPFSAAAFETVPG